MAGSGGGIGLGHGGNGHACSYRQETLARNKMALFLFVPTRADQIAQYAVTLDHDGLIRKGIFTAPQTFSMYGIEPRMTFVV